MGNILTFDVGTTTVKTLLFDERFNVLARHGSEYQLLVQDGGVVEMNAEAYWNALCIGSRAVSGLCPAAAAGVEIVVVTTQGETLIPVDSRGEPVCNAMVWLDTRSAEEAAFLRRHFRAEYYYAATGLAQVDEVAPVSKLLNMKKTRPDTFARVAKVLLLEDYLLFRLTDRMVTERSLLSSTGYFDIRKDALFGEILDCAGIPQSLIPEALDCAQLVGNIGREAAAALGISAGTKVATGAMDQIAGAIGAGNIGTGVVTETTGTALVVGASTSTPDFSHPSRPTIYRHARPGEYFVLGLSNTAGIVLKWFKDEFCESETARYGDGVYAELDRMARGVPPGAEGLVVFPHFSGVSAPTADPHARGIFSGVTLHTGKAHFIRAIMEGVAYMLREHIALFEQMGISVRQVRSSGGGARSETWSQIKADVLGREIVVLRDSESASIGAAMLGALAAGWYPSLESMGSANPQTATYRPDDTASVRYVEMYAAYQRLHRCRML